MIGQAFINVGYAAGLLPRDRPAAAARSAPAVPSTATTLLILGKDHQRRPRHELDGWWTRCAPAGSTASTGSLRPPPPALYVPSRSRWRATGCAHQGRQAAKKGRQEGAVQIARPIGGQEPRRRQCEEPCRSAPTARTAGSLRSDHPGEQGAPGAGHTEMVEVSAGGKPRAGVNRGRHGRPRQQPRSRDRGSGH